MKFTLKYLPILCLTIGLFFAACGQSNQSNSQTNQNNAVVAQNKTNTQHSNTSKVSSTHTQAEEQSQKAKNLGLQNASPKEAANKPRTVLKGSKYFSFPKNSSEAQAADFLENPAQHPPKTFTFKNFGFRKELPQLTFKAKKSLKNIAQLFAAYQGMNVEIAVTKGINNAALAKERGQVIIEHFKKIGIPQNRIKLTESQSTSNTPDVELHIVQK